MAITTAAAAKRYAVSQRRIQRLIEQNRIPGAKKIGLLWVVPDDFSILPPAHKHAPIKIKIA